MDWDPAVKSLVNFPDQLSMMSEKLDLTIKIGDAFLEWQADVMNTIQVLRNKAKAEGNLQSNDQQKVEVQAAPTTATASNTTVVNVQTGDGSAQAPRPWFRPRRRSSPSNRPARRWCTFRRTTRRSCMGHGLIRRIRRHRIIRRDMSPARRFRSAWASPAGPRGVMRGEIPTGAVATWISTSTETRISIATSTARNISRTFRIVRPTDRPSRTGKAGSTTVRIARAPRIVTQRRHRNSAAPINRRGPRKRASSIAAGQRPGGRT